MICGCFFVVFDCFWWVFDIVVFLQPTSPLRQKYELDKAIKLLIDKTKKVGLFSERRFLIFTKRGPIEITFKPIHYSAAFLSLLVGFTSIIYWSAIGIYSAIDVAEKLSLMAAEKIFYRRKRKNCRWKAQWKVCNAWLYRPYWCISNYWSNYSRFHLKV